MITIKPKPGMGIIFEANPDFSDYRPEKDIDGSYSIDPDKVKWAALVGFDPYFTRIPGLQTGPVVAKFRGLKRLENYYYAAVYTAKVFLVNAAPEFKLEPSDVQSMISGILYGRKFKVFGKLKTLYESFGFADQLKYPRQPSGFDRFKAIIKLAELVDETDKDLLPLDLPRRPHWDPIYHKDQIKLIGLSLTEQTARDAIDKLIR